MSRRIVFAMTSAAGMTGGVATANLNVLHALVATAGSRGLALEVISFQEDEQARPSFLPREAIFRACRGRRSLFVGRVLLALLNRPLLVFDHVRLALVALPFARMGIQSFVLFAHGRAYWRSLRRLDRMTIEAATLVLTNSHFTLRKMRERIPGFGGRACPLGLSPLLPLNDEPPQPAINLALEATDGVTRPLGDQMFLLVGRLEPGEREKGHDPVLRALARLHSAHPGAQVVFAGPGADRERLARAAVALGVGSAVFLPGFVADPQLRALYSRCCAFVMPSRQEGFGLVYLEAMNHAKPCVGCFDDGAEDVIVHGCTGLLVRDPEDPAELVAILSSLLSNPALAAEMGRNGLERLHRHFTAAQYQQRIRDELDAILARHGGRLREVKA